VSQATINTANAKYQGVPLSPATLATAIVRNVLPDSSGGAGKAPANYPPPLLPSVGAGTPDQEAALSGLQADRFKALVGATGMSYGVVDALRMLNRSTGLWSLVKNVNPTGNTPLYNQGNDLGSTYGITADDLAGVVAHSDIRPEYIPQLLKLARNSISPADAVEMVVKQVIDETTGSDLYGAAGGIPNQFAALVDSAGDSLGAEKLVDLLAHGSITQEQAQQALGMSRVNPRFYYAYITAAGGPGPVHNKYLAPYEVGEAVSTGHATAAQGLTWLLDEGYDAEQAKAFINAKTVTAVAKIKEDTASQVLQLYSAHLYTQDQTTTALANLGYVPAAITVMESQAEARAMISAHNSAVARVRASYLVGEINKTQVKTDLQALNVPAEAITAFVTDWDVELATPTKHLSAAEIGKLCEMGKITVQVAQSKWVASGFSANDAALLVILYPPPNPVVPGAGTAVVTG
jgi:hypothetical protein